MASTSSSQPDYPNANRIVLMQCDCNYEQKEGVISISANDIEWAPKHQVGHLSVYFTIKQLHDVKVSKTNARLRVDVKLDDNNMMTYIFDFASTKERDEAKRIMLTQKNAIKKASISEIDRIKLNLLNADPKLRALYDDLVMNRKILTADEFWQTKQSLLQREQFRPKQAVGVKNAILAEIRKSVESNQTSTFRITPTLSTQIFLVYPAVERAFKEYVPEKLAAEEFWTRFFKSSYYHRDKNDSSTASKSKEEIEMFERHEQEIEKKSQNEPLVAPVEKYVDLRREDDRIEEYGSKMNDDETMNSKTRISSVVKNYNKQSLLVMKKTVAEISEPLQPGHNIEEEESTPRKHTILDDLIDDKRESYVNLQIQDKHRYLEAHSVESTEKQKEYNASDLFSAFKEELIAFQPDFQVSLAPEVTNRIVKEIERLSETASEGISMMRLGEQNSIVPKDYVDRVNIQISTLNEMLRYFWAYATQVNPNTAKLERLVNRIKEIRETLVKISQEKKNVNVSEHKLQSIINPQLQRIEYVYNKYKEITGKSMHPTAPPPASPMMNKPYGIPNDASSRMVFQLSGPSSNVPTRFQGINLISPNMMASPMIPPPTMPVMPTAPPVISLNLNLASDTQQQPIEIDDSIDDVFDRPKKKQKQS